MQNLVFCNSEVSGYGNKLEDQITAVLWFKKTKKNKTKNPPKPYGKVVLLDIIISFAWKISLRYINSIIYEREVAELYLY